MLDLFQRLILGMVTSINDRELQRIGLNVVRIEAESVAALRERIDAHFVAACRLMLDCAGRIVVTGMGKSGHIGGKSPPPWPAPEHRPSLSTPAKPATVI